MKSYYIGSVEFSSNAVVHYGVKGQKWGVRRYVNPDGTLTPEGERRYGTKENFDRHMEDKRRLEQQRQDARFESSKARGRELYNSGYSHGKNILKTVGKMSVTAALYGIGASATRSLGMKKLSAAFVIGGAANVASIANRGIRKGTDYERYMTYSTSWQKDKKRR